MAADPVGRDLKAVLEEREAQLTSVTFQIGTFWYFRWPYQANVMKMLEKIS